MARARLETSMPAWSAPLAVALLGVLLVMAAGLGGGWSFTPRFGLWDATIPEAESRDRLTRTMPPPELNGPVGPMPLWLTISIAAVAVLAVIGLVYLVWRRWPRRLIRVETVEIARPEAAGTDVLALRRGAETALELLDRIADPHDAVVRSWLALELAAERSGAPRDPAATPTEFTAQVLLSVDAPAAAVHDLLELYHRARFSDHPIGTDDVRRARASVGELSRRWRTFDDALRSSVT